MAFESLPCRAACALMNSSKVAYFEAVLMKVEGTSLIQSLVFRTAVMSAGPGDDSVSASGSGSGDGVGAEAVSLAGSGPGARSGEGSAAASGSESPVVSPVVPTTGSVTGKVTFVGNLAHYG